MRLLYRCFDQMDKNKMSRNQKETQKKLKKMFGHKTFRSVLIGQAGTGKSRVINAFTHFAVLWGCRDRVLLCASTGIAAVQIATYINAYTINAGLGVDLFGKYDKVTSQKQRNRHRLYYIVICDEMSMVSNTMMYRFNERLKTLRENKKLFGGLDVLFSGDFHQLSPVKATALYQKLHSSNDNYSDKVIKGNKVWHDDFNFFFEITFTFRSNKSYGQILQEIRNYRPSAQTIKAINARKVSSTLVPPSNVRIISPTNDLIDAISHAAFLKKIKQINYISDAPSFSECNYIRILMNVTTKWKQNDMEFNDTALNHQIRLSNKGDLRKFSGYLEIFVGIPCLGTYNINMAEGYVNGIPCHVGKIFIRNEKNIIWKKYQNRWWVPETYASNVSGVLLRHTIPRLRKKEIIPGYPGYFLSKIRSYKGTYELPHAKVKIAVKQFPFRPSIAMTGHRGQGSTFKNIFILGWGNHLNCRDGWIYTALSRVDSIENLYIMQPMSVQFKTYKRNQYVIEEMKRLSVLATKTLKKINTILKLLL